MTELVTPRSARALRARLPCCRGRLSEYADLSRRLWFKCGGAAEVLFEPRDEEDLARMLEQKPRDIPLTVLGAGSNILVRSGGLKGLCVLLTSPAFAHKAIDAEGVITAGAALGDMALARFAQSRSRAGLEFYAGIPGSLGGAVRMNAGAAGTETKDRLLEARVLDAQGGSHTLSCQQLGFDYRHSDLKPDDIVVSARWHTLAGEKGAIAERMEALRRHRTQAQPIKEKTGGSTFKNPAPHKAWQLIERAGFRGKKLGEAQVSTHHCNFLINCGRARPEDLEDLGESVRRAVRQRFGITLEWEIVRLGLPLLAQGKSHGLSGAA